MYIALDRGHHTLSLSYHSTYVHKSLLLLWYRRTTRIIFIHPHLDAVSHGRGKVFNKPWRAIKRAADNISRTTPLTIREDRKQGQIQGGGPGGQDPPLFVEHYLEHIPEEIRNIKSQLSGSLF